MNSQQPGRLGQHYQRYNTVAHNYNPWNNDVEYRVGPPQGSDRPWSVQQEPDIQYKEWVHYINVNSQDRDTDNYSEPNQYVIKLPHELRNITSVELVNGVIPDQNNVTREPYLTLHVDELENTMIGTNADMCKAFAILLMNPPVEAGYFINVYHRAHERVIKYYKTPKANLTKMTVSIRDRNGDLFDFGGNTDAYDNTFTFKVTVIEKDRGSLQQRAIL